MSFRFWFLCGRLAPVLFLAILAGFVFRGHSAGVALGFAAGLAVAALGVIGAVLGIRGVFRPLQMRCPCCGKPGPIGYRKPEGLFMVCGGCGVVHPADWWSWRLVRSPLSADAAAALPAPEEPPQPKALVFPGLSFRGWFWVFPSLAAGSAIASGFLHRPNWLAICFSLLWCGLIGAFLNGALRQGRLDDNAGVILRRKYPALFWMRVALWSLSLLFGAALPVLIAIRDAERGAAAAKST